MDFQHSYFEDEVRDGFYIPGLMKRTWAAQLEVLSDIDQICRKHNIRWFADCGTLIGAVRHGGYIPWDDDLDICMTRNNYNRFLKVAEKELSSEYEVLNIYTKDIWDSYLTRVAEKKYISFEKEQLDKFHDFPFQAGIDIFPLDYLARDPEAEAFRKNTVEIVSAVIESVDDTLPLSDESKTQLQMVEELCSVTLDRSRPIKQQLRILTDHLCSLYQPEESDELALMTYFIKDGSHRYPKNCFEHTVMIPFETIRIPVPVMYDQVLQIEYGDYMRIAKRGGSHDYPFYKRFEVKLDEKFGAKLPQYTFAEEDLQKNLSTVKTEKLQKITEAITLLSKLHGAIQAGIQTEQDTVVMEYLASCQQCAIAVGNLIESLKGENFCTVHRIEEYCEQIYSIHEELAQGNRRTAEEVSACLESRLEQVKSSVEQDVMGRKEVVFLPYKASAWDGFQSAWKEAKKDPSCDVYVIPIPYFERHGDGSIGEMYYDGDQYPDDVPITDWQTYHLEERQPDVIIIQNPFDECSCTMSVHPAFYAKQLKDYTEQLIYIPPFVTDEIDPDDEKAMYNTRYYITMPGVVHADQVIVQSEKMRQTYIDVLTEFAGKETRPVWEKKILGAASLPQEERKITKKELNIPGEWKQKIVKEDGTCRKVILYHVSVSKLYQYKEQAIDKIHSVLSTFYEHRGDIILLWKPDALLQDSLDSCCPELGREYRKIVEKYLEENWGIYDGDMEWETVVELCDAYYGDPSAIVQRFRNVGKPVMIEDVLV